MKPEKFSTLEMYGRREVFKKKQSEGYTEVAFGGGDWVGAERIVAIWTFYHPAKKFRNVSTLQHPKHFDGEHTLRGTPFEKDYSQREFEEYVQKMQIRIHNKQNLAELLQNWDEEKPSRK